MLQARRLLIRYVYTTLEMSVWVDTEKNFDGEFEMGCVKCGMKQENIEYWDTHQTMSDYRVWCTNGR
jgi:hypothetical protein